MADRTYSYADAVSRPAPASEPLKRWTPLAAQFRAGLPRPWRVYATNRRPHAPRQPASAVATRRGSGRTRRGSVDGSDNPPADAPDPGSHRQAPLVAGPIRPDEGSPRSAHACTGVAALATA